MPTDPAPPAPAPSPPTPPPATRTARTILTLRYFLPPLLCLAAGTGCAAQADKAEGPNPDNASAARSGRTSALSERVFAGDHALAVDLGLLGRADAWPAELPNLESDASTALGHVGGAGSRLVVHLIPIDRARVLAERSRCVPTPPPSEESFLGSMRPFLTPDRPCATTMRPLLLVRNLAARASPAHRPRRECINSSAANCIRLFFLDNSVAAVRAGLLSRQPATPTLFVIGYGLDEEANGRIVCGIDAGRYADERRHWSSAQECLRLFNATLEPEE